MEFCKTIKLKDGRECIIRQGTKDDAKEALDVFILTHKETDNLLSVPEEIEFTVEEQADYLAKKAQSKNEVELVAVVDGKIVGLGGIDAPHNRIKTKHRADFGVSVIREYWGLGIGTALLDICIELCKEAGYEQLELDVVSDNISAIEMYKRAGFTEYGRNPRGFKSPTSGYQELVQMRLELK